MISNGEVDFTAFEKYNLSELTCYMSNNSIGFNFIQTVQSAISDEFNYLFTGDIESEAEADLILKYGNNLVSDVLKVAHHGSQTSSSLDFLNVVNPKYLLLSVGRGNIYNFPNNKHILNMHNVYRTDISNSITLYKRKKFFCVEK